MSRKIVGVTVGTPTKPAAVKEKLELATEKWVQEGYQPKGEYLTKTELKPVKETADNALELAGKADKKADALREVISKFHSSIVCDASGEIIVLDNASDMELAGLRIFGKTTQNGTPTSAAPVPLESVGDHGSVDVTVYGANLLGKIESNLGVGNAGSGNSVFYIAGCSCLLAEVKPNVVYTVSRKSVNTNARFRMGFTEKKLDYATRVPTPVINNQIFSYDTSTVCTLVAPENARYLYIYVDNVGAEVDLTQYMMNVGESALAFEPYTEQFFAISTPTGLPGIPVSIGGNYTDQNGQCWICDEMDFAKGVYVQRIGKLDSYAGEEITGAYLSSTGSLSSGATVLYALTKSNEIPMTAEELAQYATLHTNYPNTTIYNDGGANMEVLYVADTKMYVDKKFEELATALLNQ